MTLGTTTDDILFLDHLDSFSACKFGPFVREFLTATRSQIRGASHSAMTMQHQPLQQTTLHRYLQQDRQRCQGEGYCASTCTVEAEAWTQAFCNDPANGGQRPPMGLGSNDPDRPRTIVHKRSFMRACRRALIHGHSHYHGRYMRPQDFPAALRHKVQDTQSGDSSHSFQELACNQKWTA